MLHEKNDMRSQFSQAIGEYQDLGGWESFKSGEWLWNLIQRSLVNYWQNANLEYFKAKYCTSDKKVLTKKLTAVAAKNAAILGSVAGAAVSTDEIIGFATGGEVGVGIPANLAIAAAAIGGEAILLIHIQLQLIANLGRLYGVSLDPDDPEDILTILAFSLGGSAAQAAGRIGMKVGQKLAERAVKCVFKKEVLATLKRIAAKVGIKVLQRSIIKYTVPIASIGIGSTWNYVSTKTVAKIATKHFKQRAKELGVG